MLAIWVSLKEPSLYNNKNNSWLSRGQIKLLLFGADVAKEPPSIFTKVAIKASNFAHSLLMFNQYIVSSNHHFLKRFSISPARYQGPKSLAQLGST